MRFRVLRYLLAILPLSVLAAQEPVAFSTSGTNWRGAKFHHDVLLRDGGVELVPLPSYRLFPLPPGGRELELQPTSSTPYDPYFSNVRAVIAGMETHGTTMGTACHLMKVGHSFEYVSRDPYRPDPPKLTEIQHSGDCKSKALWLFDNLADPDALFVIGKSEKYLRTAHAWVYWRSGGRWWILDCTDRADPIAADSVSPDRYIPYYSFGKLGTYRHPATRVNPMAANNVATNPAVGTAAAGSKNSR